MITYTTTIESEKYHKIEGNLQNVIKSISVRRVGIHTNGYRSEFWDKLDFDTPHDSQFTPYESVTNDMRISWIDSHPSNFNTKSEGYISAAIQQQIDSNEVEVVYSPLA